MNAGKNQKSGPNPSWPSMLREPQREKRSAQNLHAASSPLKFLWSSALASKTAGFPAFMIAFACGPKLV